MHDKSGSFLAVIESGKIKIKENLFKIWQIIDEWKC